MGDRHFKGSVWVFWLHATLALFSRNSGTGREEENGILWILPHTFCCLSPLGCNPVSLVQGPFPDQCCPGQAHSELHMQGHLLWVMHQPLSHNLGVCASRWRNNQLPAWSFWNPAVKCSDATFHLICKSKKMGGKERKKGEKWSRARTRDVFWKRERNTEK